MRGYRWPGPALAQIEGFTIPHPLHLRLAVRVGHAAGPTALEQHLGTLKLDGNRSMGGGRCPRSTRSRDVHEDTSASPSARYDGQVAGCKRHWPPGGEMHTMSCSTRYESPPCAAAVLGSVP